MGEDGDREGENGGEHFDRDHPQLGELLDHLREGRRLPRECSRCDRVEHDDGESSGADGRLDQGGETIETIARDDDGARLHLEHESRESEAERTIMGRAELPDAADFPGVEGGVLERMATGDEDERPRITAGRKGFEHMRVRRGSWRAPTTRPRRGFARCR